MSIRKDQFCCTNKCQHCSNWMLYSISTTLIDHSCVSNISWSKVLYLISNQRTTSLDPKVLVRPKLDLGGCMKALMLFGLLYTQCIYICFVFCSYLHFKERDRNFAKKFRFVVFVLIIHSKVKNPMHVFHLKIVNQSFQMVHPPVISFFFYMYRVFFLLGLPLKVPSTKG